MPLAPVHACVYSTMYNKSKIERTTRTLNSLQYTTSVTVHVQRTLKSYAGLFSKACARCGRFRHSRSAAAAATACRAKRRLVAKQQLAEQPGSPRELHRHLKFDRGAIATAHVAYNI